MLKNLRASGCMHIIFAVFVAGELDTLYPTRVRFETFLMQNMETWSIMWHGSLGHGVLSLSCVFSDGVALSDKHSGCLAILTHFRINTVLIYQYAM